MTAPQDTIVPANHGAPCRFCAQPFTMTAAECERLREAMLGEYAGHSIQEIATDCDVCPTCAWRRFMAADSPVTRPASPVGPEPLSNDVYERLAYAATVFRAAVEGDEGEAEVAEWFNPGFLLGVAALLDQVCAPPSSASSPDLSPDGRTHHADCWRTTGHADCAIREVERLRAARGSASSEPAPVYAHVCGVPGASGEEQECEACAHDRAVASREPPRVAESLRNAFLVETSIKIARAVGFEGDVRMDQESLIEHVQAFARRAAGSPAPSEPTGVADVIAFDRQVRAGSGRSTESPQGSTLGSSHLADYLRGELERGHIDFAVRARMSRCEIGGVAQDIVRFYIHPARASGETAGFFIARFGADELLFVDTLDAPQPEPSAPSSVRSPEETGE